MHWVLVAALWLGLGSGAAFAQARVFAAASLIDVMGALIADFGATRPDQPALILATGSSAALGRQVAAGARAEIFISANRQWADFARSRAKAVFSEPSPIFGNSLVVIVAAGSGARFALKELPVFMGRSRLALAAPESVPAGQYAKQALKNAGIWEALANKLAPADDVRGATRFVGFGAAKAGVVYATEAGFPGVEVAVKIDPALHTPIAYWMIISEAAPPLAREFADYLGGAEAAAILEGFGFVAPEGGGGS
jgi:molybdate transport system substrate-binding protein